MKKLLILSAVAGLFFTSCATTKIDLVQNSPVALVSVYSNPEVYWLASDAEQVDENRESGILTSWINKSIDKENPEYLTVQERIDYAATQLEKAFADRGISVISPSTNAAAPCYENAGTNFWDNMRNTVPAKGYDVLQSNSKKLDRNMFTSTGSKLNLYVKFVFYKRDNKDGYKLSGAIPVLNLVVFAANQDGKIIDSSSKFYYSKTAAAGKNGKYDRNQLCNLFYPLIDEAVNSYVMEHYSFEAESVESEDTQETVEDAEVILKSDKVDTVESEKEEETVIIFKNN